MLAEGWEGPWWPGQPQDSSPTPGCSPGENRPGGPPWLPPLAAPHGPQSLRAGLSFRRQDKLDAGDPHSPLPLPHSPPLRPLTAVWPHRGTGGGGEYFILPGRKPRLGAEEPGSPRGTFPPQAALFVREGSRW